MLLPKHVLHPISEQQLPLTPIKDEFLRGSGIILLIVPVAESANDVYNERKVNPYLIIREHQNMTTLVVH